MNEQEIIDRRRLRDEGRRWLRTPYRHKGGVLGAGCDCAKLLIKAHAGAGLIEDYDPGEYPPDWHLHRGEDLFLENVLAHAGFVDDDERPLDDRGADFRAEMGDVLVWRVGRTFSHGALVSDWPMVIHAYHPAAMVEEVDVRHTPMSARPMRVLSYWKAH